MELVLAEGTKIVIGGACGTGKGDVSKILARELGYELKSAGGIFRDIAIKEGITVAELGERAKKDQTVDERVDKEMEEFGHNIDHLVCEGHIAWYSVKDSVKILLICDFNERISRVAGRDKHDTFEEAKQATILREKVASERYKNLYGISDIYDPEHYTFEVNTTGVKPENVANAIIDFLKLKGMYHPLRKH